MPSMKPRRPMTPQDVKPHAGVSIPKVNYDAAGRPTVGMKTIDLLEHCKAFGAAKAKG